MASSDLEDWIAAEARYAATRMSRAISATELVMERPGFGQRVIPRAGSVLASPVPGHYDPDPDYFFHWFRDAAIVADALRVAVAAGYSDRSALTRLREFLQFNTLLTSIDGRQFAGDGNFRAGVQPAFLEYLRPDAELAGICGRAVLGDVRVNADGTLDFTRWSRPQTDGPALNAIVLLRWWQEFPELFEDPAVLSALRDIISEAMAFTLSHVWKPCSDVWEEQSGYHYFTQLLQAQSLLLGGEWLEGSGERERAGACRVAAHETLSRLDGFWNEAGGFYRSLRASEAGRPTRELDMSVVLAVLHAARTSGAHSVLDPRAQATLTALEEFFEAEFVINRDLPATRGPALGRYKGDRYYGGGAWYIATLGAAEFYFRLAQALRSGAQLPVTADNLRFRQRLGVPEPVVDAAELARRAVERGDRFMRTVQAFTPAGGELSEQFDRTSGVQTSARHLSWSYAAFITAAASRSQACRAT
jgi:glucoamylase